MAKPPLRQFDRKDSAWRFLKLALALHTPQPAYAAILIHLANHANHEGVCFPSHALLRKETRYSKRTIVSALNHWKSVGVLSWKCGWGNAHVPKGRANTYQFHEEVMENLASAIYEQASETTAPPTSKQVKSEAPSKCSHSTNKFPCEGPIKNLMSHSSKEALTPTSFSFSTGEQEGTAEQPSILPSADIAHASIPDIPDPDFELLQACCDLDPKARRWYAKRDIGRELTKQEQRVRAIFNNLK